MGLARKKNKKDLHTYSRNVYGFMPCVEVPMCRGGKMSYSLVPFPPHAKRLCEFHLRTNEVTDHEYQVSYISHVLLFP